MHGVELWHVIRVVEANGHLTSYVVKSLWFLHFVRIKELHAVELKYLPLTADNYN